MELLVICFTLLPNCASNINHTQQVQLVNPKKRDLFTTEENVIIVKMMGAKNIFHALLRKYIFLLML